MLLETRREAIIDLATEGERLGYDGFFMAETWAYDMTVLLADAAARTTRITRAGPGSSACGIAARRPSGWPRQRCTQRRADASCLASAPVLRSSRKACKTRGLSGRCRACAGMVTQILALLSGERIPLAVTTNARAQAQRTAGARAPIPRGGARRRDDAARGRAGPYAWASFLYPWSQLATGVERLREGA
jgi:hypothetical protein